MAVAVIALLGVLLARRAREEPGRVIRATLELPAGTMLDAPLVRLSRDGRRLVVIARRGSDKDLVFLRALDQPDFAPVPGTEGAQRPFLSPDGAWVVFGSISRTGPIRKVALDGGPTADVADGNWAGGDWATDGAIVYTKHYTGGLWLVPAMGGVPRPITTLDSARGEFAHWWPQFLPDGDHVLFTAYTSPASRARIETVSLRTGARKVLIPGGVSGRYLPPSYLVYARSGTLFAVRFDARRLEVRGQPVPVLQGIAMTSDEGLAAFSVADNGTLAYVAASSFGHPVDPVWVSRSGVASAPLTAPGRYRSPTLSPDGRLVALAETAPDEQDDIWVLDLQRGTRTPITSGGGTDLNPLFTPDGRRIVFISERPVFDLYIRPTDGSAPASPLVTSSHDKFPGSVTPDGRTLLFDHRLLPHTQIWSVPLGDSGTARPVLAAEDADVRTPRLAPNGRWLAYVSVESEGPEVYLSPFPDVRRARSQVSVHGGDQPRWTRGGRELVYRSGDRMMAVAVDPATGRLGAPLELFHGDYQADNHSAGVGNWDVTPDGARFLMLRQEPGSEAQHVILVTNWVRELERTLGR